jgi:hypothetical protein
MNEKNKGIKGEKRRRERRLRAQWWSGRVMWRE